MKLKSILFLSLLLLISAGFVACTKRDKLVDNTMILQIEPAGEIIMNVGDTKELKAVIKNIKMEEVSQPVKWSVSPSNLGTFDNTTSKIVTFTAVTPASSGTVTLASCGVEKTVTVTITN